MLQLGRYRHYKGQEYEVIGVATHSETEEEFVVYQALYGERNLWIRPLSIVSRTRRGRWSPASTVPKAFRQHDYIITTSHLQ